MPKPEWADLMGEDYNPMNDYGVAWSAAIQREHLKELQRKKYEFAALWEENGEWKLKSFLSGETKSTKLISFNDILAACSIDGWLICHIDFNHFTAYMQREILR